MSEIQTLTKDLSARFPDAQIELDKPNKRDGSWFLDFELNDYSLVVEWRKELGFGVSDAGTGGFGEGPDETYPTSEAAYCRIVSLVASEQRIAPKDPVRLSELRQSRGISQVALAALMKKQQASISKCERRSNIQIDTLRDLIRALGGRLQLLVSFPDGEKEQLRFDEDDAESMKRELV